MYAYVLQTIKDVISILVFDVNNILHMTCKSHVCGDWSSRGHAMPPQPSKKRANRPKEVDEEWFHTYARTQALNSDASFGPTARPTRSRTSSSFSGTRATRTCRITTGSCTATTPFRPLLGTSPLLLDLQSAFQREKVDDALKLKRLAEYNRRVSLEAELPSCACCGLRAYPVNVEVQHPLTVRQGRIPPVPAAAAAC